MPAATLIVQGEHALCLRITAVNAKQFIGSNEGIGLSLPKPTADMGQPLRFAKLDFPLMQRFFGMLALGDVTGDSELCRQGTRFRRSAQGDAAGYCRPDRRAGDFRGARTSTSSGAPSASLSTRTIRPSSAG